MIYSEQMTLGEGERWKPQDAFGAKQTSWLSLQRVYGMQEIGQVDDASLYSALIAR